MFALYGHWGRKNITEHDRKPQRTNPPVYYNFITTKEFDFFYKIKCEIVKILTRNKVFCDYTKKYRYISKN